jgi:non-homologous end joining protein Ku
MPNWAAYRDEGADELRALIEAKIAGQHAVDPDPPSVALSLMDALKQSVAAAQAPQADTPPRLAKTMRKRGRRTA